MPTIVTDANEAFYHLDHWGANKGTRWNRSASPQAVPSTTAINSAALQSSSPRARLGPLGIPVHPTSLIRLAGVTFMILGVALIRT